MISRRIAATRHGEKETMGILSPNTSCIIVMVKYYDTHHFSKLQTTECHRDALSLWYFIRYRWCDGVWLSSSFPSSLIESREWEWKHVSVTVWWYPVYIWGSDRHGFHHVCCALGGLSSVELGITWGTRYFLFRILKNNKMMIKIMIFYLLLLFRHSRV